MTDGVPRMGTCASCGRPEAVFDDPVTGSQVCSRCGARAHGAEALAAMARYLEKHGSDPCKPGECYRCWQIGNRGVKATCIVVYNAGSQHEWKAASCTDCFEVDKARFPAKVRKVLRLVEGGAR